MSDVPPIITGNPPFAGNRNGKFSGNLYRGYVNVNGYGLHFQYNPNTITVSVSSDPSITGPPTSATQPQGTGGSIINSMASVTWTLYLNRMLDVSPNGTPGALSAGGAGVLSEVAGLYNALGIFAEPGAGGQLNQGAGAGANLGTLPSYVQNAQVFFSQQAGGLFTYKGNLTGLQATFTRFTASMVPIEATLEMTITRVNQGGSGTTDPSSDNGAGLPPGVR